MIHTVQGRVLRALAAMLFALAATTAVAQEYPSGEIRALCNFAVGSGFPGYELTPWWGAVAPAGTPKPIVDRLEAWFNQIARSGQTRQFLARVATDPFPGDQKMMAALIKTDMERWGRFVKLARIEPQ